MRTSDILERINQIVAIPGEDEITGEMGGRIWKLIYQLREDIYEQLKKKPMESLLCDLWVEHDCEECPHDMRKRIEKALGYCPGGRK